MFDEALSLISMCSSMNTWLTPTVLFVLLNLMIGTIAFTSAFSHKPSHNHLHEQQQQHFHHQQQQQHQQQFQQQTQQFHYQQHQNQQPQLITRSSSVLQRLKSINFNNLYTIFYSHPPTAHYHQPQPEPVVEEPKPAQTAAVEEVDDDDENPSMEEIYNRIKQSNPVTHYNRQNSDTKPSGGEIPVKLPQKMKKSASHKSAFNHFHLQPQVDNSNKIAGVNRNSVETVEEEEERESVMKEREDEVEVEVEGGGVDAQADDFINRFKKQLLLQRKDSIMRYKEMISRTSAK